MKFELLWTNLSNIDHFFAIENPNDEEIELGAKECEKFTELFPVLFPNKSLTLKMVAMSLVLPRFIREQRLVNKMLRLEQEGE